MSKPLREWHLEDWLYALSAAGMLLLPLNDFFIRSDAAQAVGWCLFLAFPMFGILFCLIAPVVLLARWVTGFLDEDVPVAVNEQVGEREEH